MLWLGERLRLGVAVGVSLCLKRLREGEFKVAEKELEQLKSLVLSVCSLGSYRPASGNYVCS